MKDLKKINNQITVGGQPTAEDIAQLKHDGFRTIVNLRTEGEEDQPMSPDEERKAVEKAGMKYVHLPVSSATMGPETVDKFRAQLPNLKGPVLVHCASGKRSGAFAILQLADQEGLSGEDALARARTLGFDWKSPGLEGFVKGYLDQRR